jgi:hypothetical protein
MDYKMVENNGTRILFAQGEVEADESDRFLRAVRQAGKIDEFWLNSPGGSAFQGIETGRQIRKLGLVTRIPSGAKCASACSYAFLGGIARFVDVGGRYGVHMFTHSGSKALVGKVMAIIKKHGADGAQVVIQYIEQDAAKTARERARYLGEMMVSPRLMDPAFETTSDDIHWLTPRELTDYSVVNTR